MKTIHHYFEGRTLLIASQHAKELAMQPVLESALGVRCFVATDFNTDAFGTFTGEVERTLPPLETLRAKINSALDITGHDMAVGSEGSFGPHPQIPFVPADVELVMLIDRKHKLEIVASHLTTETNFSQATVASMGELTNFLDEVGFPTNGVILKNEITGAVKKGIITWDDLHHQVCALELGKNTLKIETDMRAVYNSLRMKAIAHTTQLLIEKINSQCPSCGTPGFSESEWITGLPCEACGEPTELTKQKIKRCSACACVETEDVAQQEASAQYCDYCNP